MVMMVSQVSTFTFDLVPMVLDQSEIQQHAVEPTEKKVTRPPSDLKDLIDLHPWSTVPNLKLKLVVVSKVSNFEFEELRMKAADKVDITAAVHTVGTEAAGTEAAGTVAAGTVATGTEAASTEATGTEAVGTEAAGTVAAGTVAAGTKFVV